MTWPRSLSKCPFCGKPVCYDEGGCGCKGEEDYYYQLLEEKQKEGEYGTSIKHRG